MKFEFDPNKSASNRIEHGIDFNEAQALWSDSMLLEAPARITDEPRFIVIGKIGRRHWTAVCTHRGERIRIISVRRATAKEVKRYDESP